MTLDLTGLDEPEERGGGGEKGLAGEQKVEDDVAVDEDAADHSYLCARCAA